MAEKRTRRTTTNPAGQRLCYWLGLTMRAAREAAGVTPTDVASRAGISESSVTRFERGVSWPRHPDHVLAAYADFDGTADPREFYERALKLWRKQGEPPILEAETAIQRVQAVAERATRRKQQARDAQPETPAATPKKREAG